MHIKFTNTDSTGSPTTKSLSVTIDGESHTVTVSSTGTANVSRDVGEYLIESDKHAVVSHDGDGNTEVNPAVEADEDVEANADAVIDEAEADAETVADADAAVESDSDGDDDDDSGDDSDHDTPATRNRHPQHRDRN